MSRLFNRLGSLFGGRPAVPVTQGADALAGFYPAGQFERRATTEEKVSAGPRGLKLPWFLPYFDANTTGETPGMRRAFRLMWSDPNVKAAALGKSLAVGAQDLQLLPAEKKSQRDRDIAEHAHWNLSERVRGGFPGLAWEILSGGLTDGFSLSEKVWGLEDRSEKYRFKWSVRAVKSKDVDQDVVLEVDEYRNVAGVKGYRYNAGDVFDPRDFVIFAHLPFYSSPVGMSDFRAVYARWWILDAVIKMRASGIEKRAYGMLVGEYQLPSQKPSLEASLEAAKFSTWMSVPAGIRLQVLDVMQKGDDVIASFCKDLREDIFMGIQGALLQALTSGEGAQRGNSTVHKDTADLIKWYLSAALCACLNDRENGLLADWTDRNYRGAEPPRVALGGIDEAELAESAKLDSILLDNGLPLSKEEAYDKYGRRVPSGPDDVLKKAAPGGPPGLGGTVDGNPPGFSEADVDGLVEYFCGGPGSGVPGPCPDHLKQRSGESVEQWRGRLQDHAAKEAAKQQRYEKSVQAGAKVIGAAQSVKQALDQGSQKLVGKVSDVVAQRVVKAGAALAKTAAGKAVAERLTPHIEQAVHGIVGDLPAHLATAAIDTAHDLALSMAVSDQGHKRMVASIASTILVRTYDAVKNRLVASHAEVSDADLAAAVRHAKAILDAVAEEAGIDPPDEATVEAAIRERLGLPPVADHAEPGEGSAARPFRETSWGYRLGTR